jgi:hypothetical protein
MNRNVYVFCSLAVALGGLSGCGPSTKDAKKAVAAPDKIQGKIQLDMDEMSASDAALNAGGSSTYLWAGLRRYRLFFKSPTPVEAGKEYVVEGVYAQRIIDEVGDPDQGKGGYPLQSSCERVVKTAWPGLAFDVTDLHAAALRTRVKRYPARPVFLVTRITPVAAKEGGDSAAAKKEAEAEEKIPEVSVPAEKQQALLIEGSTAQAAPLWEPAGRTIKCRVIIGTDGKIAELDTGAQLCEAVDWAKFRYQPTVQRGRPVKVKTEVEIRFDPRK